MRNPFRWLRTRNAAIASRRVDHAARFKGVVGIGGQTPDDLMAVADEVAEARGGCIWPSCTFDKACTPDEAACEPVDPQPTYREEQIGRGMTS